MAVGTHLSPKAQSVKFNLSNFVRHKSLGQNQGLRPVYEAIANAFDSIHESPKLAKPKIVVRIRRLPSDPVQPLGRAQDIVGFEVTDNGVGFTDANFNSFGEAYSPMKAATNGIGAGRFLWLKAFERAEVSSNFRDGEGKLRHRQFRFELPDGVTNEHISEAAATRKTGATVRLLNMLSGYKCPQSSVTICRHIIEHFLGQLLASPTVGFYLDDEVDGQTDLRALMSQELQSQADESFKIGRHKFTLRHFLAQAKSGGCISSHRVNLCARKRCIEPFNLGKIVPDLKEALLINGKLFYYLCTVESSYLDRSVNDTRTGLDIPEMPSTTSETSQSEIMKTVADKAEKHLAEPLAALRASKNGRVRHVINQTAPELKTVVERNPDILNSIPVDASEREILTTVSGQRYVEREAYLKLLAEMMQVSGAGDRIESTRKLLMERFANASSTESAIILAEFVFHRRAVLDVLNELLCRDSSDKSQKEEAVHQIIFPLRTTSGEFPPDLANLWVLDERLAFHHYLASDKTLDSMDPIESDSRREPDIIVFQKAHLATETPDCPDAITIIEFKRPTRDNYTFDDNPYRQIKRYVDLIRTGKAYDRQNKLIEVRPSARFFCYIVADMTPTLKDVLMNVEGFVYGADNNVMFRTEPTLPMYTEAISYQKMILDAKRRNRSFFRQLGID